MMIMVVHLQPDLVKKWNRWEKVGLGACAVRHARKPENQTLYRSTNFGSYVSYTKLSVMYAGREHILCAVFRVYEEEITRRLCVGTWYV